MVRDAFGPQLSPMHRRTLLLGLGALAAVGAAGLTGRAFTADLAAARARTQGRSSLIAGRFGALEYASEGDGPPVLMIHGTGGGFDDSKMKNSISGAV